MDLKNKVVLLTGASTGIGSGIAKAFLERGSKVIVLGLHKPRFCSQFYAVDVGREEEIVSALSAIAAIDVLINNAAVDRNALITETSNDILEEMLRVNLKGLFRMSKHAASKLHARGCIINIGSVAGIRSYPESGLYGATKAAVMSITETLALELASRRIRVNCIAPGVIDTPIWKKRYGARGKRILKDIVDAYVPLKRAGKPEEIAKTAVFICENDYVNGMTIVVDGGEHLV